MSGKDGIINDILDNATSQAESIIKNATIEQEKALNNEKQLLEEKKKELLDKTDIEVREIGERKNTITGLESRKILLGAKQDLIKNVYKKAEQKLLELPDKEYLALMSDLIVKYAVEGDSVLVNEKDSKRLNQDWLDSANKKAGLKLKFAKTHHSYEGGLILTCDKYDKNLTISALVKEVKPTVNDKIVSILFN